MNRNVSLIAQLEYAKDVQGYDAVGNGKRMGFDEAITLTRQSVAALLAEMEAEIYDYDSFVIASELVRKHLETQLNQKE